MAVVYKHTRMDNGLPFYIGIGKTIKRAKSKRERNKYWHNIVNKYGYNIEILHTNISWEEACELEKKYIKQYGRTDLGLGPLVNMTDGGEGVINISQESRKKIRERMLGHTYIVGEKNPCYGLYGKNHPRYGVRLNKEQKEVFIKQQLGENNSFYGKTHNKETKKKWKENGRHIGEKNPNSVLNIEKVIEIRKLFNMGKSVSKLAKMFNCGWGTVNSVIKRKTWKHI
jgi:Mor family transcriptional regulator